MKRLVDNDGSIGGRMGRWNLLVFVAKYFGVRPTQSGERNIAQKSVFISIGKFLFGTKDLRVYTFLQQQSLKKASEQTPQENLRKDIYLKILSRKARGLVRQLNLQKVLFLGTRELNINKYFGNYIRYLLTGTQSIAPTLLGMVANQSATIASLLTIGQRLIYITGTSIVPIMN